MITLTNSQLNGLSGVHGEYIKLSANVGVKLIHSSTFKSQIKALRSRAWKLASAESENLRLAFDSGVVPMSYGVSLVKVDKGYRVGVLMQHLGSLTLSNSDFFDSSEIFEELNEALREVGITHFDLHEDNIMVYRGKFYAVDFAPESIEYK